MNEKLEKIREEAEKAAEELIAAAHLASGDILVIGCSSSEVAGQSIGSNSSVEVAEAVFDGICKSAQKGGIYIAVQCCEHLNRALIVEAEVAGRERLTEVNVIPQPKAGGSFATTAYKRMKNPTAVEYIKADAGMDIGNTLIGMHLKQVAVPVRLSVVKIGCAPVVCARTRAKYIGGQRAIYKDE